MAVLGIDFGGSGIKGALVDVTTGELVSERYRLSTPENGRSEEVANVIAEIVKHFEYHGPLGIGFPAVILNGVVYTAANIDPSWIGINSEVLFERTTGCKSFVVNDADSAGVAEMAFGIGKEFNRGITLFLTLGTGIGSAIFLDGKLLPNTEFGHLEIRGKDAEKRAGDAVRKRKELTWEEWSVRLQEVLARMEALIWPDMIVLGGGVSREWINFIPRLKLRARVEPARLLNQAGIIGAAMYAWQRSQE